MKITVFHDLSNIIFTTFVILSLIFFGTVCVFFGCVWWPNSSIIPPPLVIN